MKTFTDSLAGAVPGATHLFWAGQAGFIIKNEAGKTLGIDLYLSDCVEDVEGHTGYHRLMPQIADPEDLHLDVLVCTHFHRDHFDIGSVPQLMANGNTRLVCACDCREDVGRLGIDLSRTTFVVPGDVVEVCGFKLTFVDADHGDGAPQAVGVIVTADGRRVLEVGDTCLHLEWKDEYLKEGELDVLIAPINGAYGNLNENEHVALTAALSPRLAIPCHFGMFASHGGNPGLWRDLLESTLPGQQYKLFTMGEGIEI